MHVLHSTLILAGALMVALPAGAQTYGGDSMKPKDKAQTFVATLSGTKEVPAVNTIGSGTAKFTVHDSTISYELTVQGMVGVTAAHIHLGGVGTSGAPVATLYHGKGGSGQIAHGVLSAKNLKGTTMAALIAAMQSGDAYVNVHTTAHPGGEIRGEIEPSPSSTVSQVTH